MRLHIQKTKLQKLRERNYRNSYNKARNNQGIAHQIRLLRTQRNLSQTELAKLLETQQTAISRLEDPSYGKYSVNTLLDLARTFDVALSVEFVPWSKFLNRVEQWCPENATPPTFDEELQFLECDIVPSNGTARKIAAINATAPTSTFYVGEAGSNQLTPAYKVLKQ